MNAQNPQDCTKEAVEMHPVVVALCRFFDSRLNSDDPEVRTRTRRLAGVAVEKEQVADGSEQAA